MLGKRNDRDWMRRQISWQKARTCTNLRSTCTIQYTCKKKTAIHVSVTAKYEILSLQLYNQILIKKGIFSYVTCT